MVFKIISRRASSRLLCHSTDLLAIGRHDHQMTAHVGDVDQAVAGREWRDGEAGHEIFQLHHVARKRIGTQRAQRDRHQHAPWIGAVQKPASEHRHVADAVPERRNLEA
jgi:hypothetical protein